MKNIVRCCCLLSLIAFAFIPSRLLSASSQWAQWRGPQFNGSSEAGNLPVTWSAETNLLWSAPLPGMSGATPVIWNDALFVTSPDTNQNLLLLSFDARTGKLRWERKVSPGNRERGRNNMASPSPVTDGKAVFALFATGDLAAYDFSGKQLWSRQLAKDYGAFSHMWIYGSSPLLWHNRLLIQVLQRSPVPSDYAHAREGDPIRDSYILCLDPATGTNLWRHIRRTDAKNETMESYATPVPYPDERGGHFLVFGANHLTAHELATGNEIWRGPTYNANDESWWRVVPTPVVADRIAITCAPKRQPIYAIQPPHTATNATSAWTFTEFTPDCVTPLLYRGRLYVLDGDRQVMTALEPATGRKIWQGDLGLKDIFRSSPTGADGKIYCISENGNTVVLAAGDNFQIIATNRLGEAPVRASIPALDGRLYIRGARNLYCVGAR